MDTDFVHLKQTDRRTQDWWDRHFVRCAKEYAEASKDPSTKVGAVIVRPDSWRTLSTTRPASAGN